MSTTAAYAAKRQRSPKTQPVAKAPDPMDDLVRKNLKRFREEAGLSQQLAADLSGVGIDNLRRYENGKTERVPFSVVAMLAPVYGHSVGDFSLVDPPPAKLEEAPTVFLMTRPGVEVPPDKLARLKDQVDQVNREIKTRRKR